MPRPKSKKSWLQLPGWGALMVSLGALFATETPPATAAPSPHQDTPGALNERGAATDEVMVRTEGGRIYISEGGRAFEELLLGNTTEAAYLRKLLGNAGAGGASISVPVGTIIVANGGGQGDGAKPKPSSSSSSEQGRPATRTSAPEKPKGEEPAKK